MSRSGSRRRCVAPPAVEVRARDDVGGDRARRRTRSSTSSGTQQVAAAGALLERVDLLERACVGGQEVVPGLPVALDERAADEQLARERRGRSARTATVRPVDDRQPVERHPLGRHDRARGARPSAARSTCARRGARPAARPTSGRSARRRGPTAARSPPARRPSPTRAGLPRERGAGEDREPRAARAEVLAAAAASLTPTCESRPESSAWCTSAGSAGCWLSEIAELLGRAPQLAGEVLPLAHAQVVQELGLAALAGTGCPDSTRCCSRR